MSVDCEGLWLLDYNQHEVSNENLHFFGSLAESPRQIVSCQCIALGDTKYNAAHHDRWLHKTQDKGGFWLEHCGIDAMLLRASLRAQTVTVSEHLHHTALYHRPRDVHPSPLCCHPRAHLKIYIDTYSGRAHRQVSSAVQRSLIYL